MTDLILAGCLFMALGVPPVFQQGSYLLIGVVLVLTGAGLPIPEEVPIITAGIMASHGQLDPWMAFFACLVGALLGDCVMYLIGYCFGRSLLRDNRYWVYFVKPEREAQMEDLISRHGLKVLFFARFLVGLRSPVYLSAGILKLQFRRFFLIDLFCATSVIGVFFLLSFYYGRTITRWIQRAEIAASVALVLVLLITALIYWRLHRRRRVGGTAETSETPPSDHGSSQVADLEIEQTCLLETEQVA